VTDRLLLVVDVRERHRRLADAERDLAFVLDALERAGRFLGDAGAGRKGGAERDDRSRANAQHGSSSCQMAAFTAASDESIDRARRRTISSSSASLTMYGGASSTWS